MPPNSKDDELMEHRVTQLENNQKEQFSSINKMTEILIRWDTKFENLDFMQLSAQNEKLTEGMQRVKAIETEVESLKKFQWKLIGGGLVFLFVIQTFIAPFIMDRTKPSEEKQVQVYEVYE